MKLVKYWMIGLLLALGVLGPTLLLEGAQILPAGIEGGSNVTLRLEPDEVAIFGYGSLMIEKYLEHPNDEPYTGPFIMARLKGFKRSWSVHYPNEPVYFSKTDNGTYVRDVHGEYALPPYCFEDEGGERVRPKTNVALNLEPYENSKVNGMIFVCLKKDLPLYDSRECSYNRHKINDCLEGVSVIGGSAYTYVAKAEYFKATEELLPVESVVDSFYVGIIEEALNILGEDFEAEYRENTQPVPEHLVKDLRRDEREN